MTDDKGAKAIEHPEMSLDEAHIILCRVHLLFADEDDIWTVSANASPPDEMEGAYVEAWNVVRKHMLASGVPYRAKRT